MNVSVPSQFTIIQEEPLYYSEGGEGLPVVLLHAGVADSRMWKPQMDALDSSFHLLAPDLKGYGQSPLPNGPFSYHKDIAGLLDAKALQSVWLAGISFGGRVALDFALTYPDRVRGLILISPIIPGLQVSEALEAFGEEEDCLLEAGDLEAAIELNLTMWVDGPYRSSQQVDELLRSNVSEMQRKAFLNPEPENVELLRLAPPAMARLHELEIPVLIVIGDLDVPDVAHHAQVLMEKAPNAQLAVIEGAAHMLTLEEPDRFNQLAQDFIETVERGRNAG